MAKKLEWKEYHDVIALLYSKTQKVEYYNELYPLIDKMIKLIMWVDKKANHYDKKDIIQQLHIQCHKALLNLDESKGRAFSYIQKTIFLYTKTYTNETKIRSNSVPIDRNIKNKVIFQDTSNSCYGLYGYSPEEYIENVNSLIAKCKIVPDLRNGRGNITMDRISAVLEKAKDNPDIIMYADSFNAEYKKMHNQTVNSYVRNIRSSVFKPKRASVMKK